MAIREIVEKNKTLLGILAPAVIVLCIIYIFLRLRSPDTDPVSRAQIYYSNDDGKTFFAAEEQVPPIQKDGKPAYQAYVFSCDGGVTPLVGYLARYTPEAKKELERIRRSGSHEDSEIVRNGLEVKKPGQTEWVNDTDIVRAAQVRRVQCANRTEAMPVNP